MASTFEYPANHGLPDPVRDAQFYDGVPARRLIAWIIDAIIILVLGLLTVTFLGIVTFGLAFIFSFFLAMVTSFVYRCIFITTKSATPGMMLMGIEFRTFRGQKFGLKEAVIHTAMFMFLFSTFIGQVASCILMATTNYGRSLPDLLLGSTVINKELQ